MGDTCIMLNPVKSLPKINFLALSGCSSTPQTNNPNGYAQGETPQLAGKSSSYNDSELVNAISDHLGVTAAR